MFDATKIQPTNNIFEIQIGGLQLIYQYPQVPVAFKVRIVSLTGLGTVSFTLFDATGADVEPHLWAARDDNGGGVAQGRFRFGYTAQGEELLSRWFNFILQGYTVSIEKSGFVLSCTGTITNTAVATLASNQISGTFRECVSRFEALHNTQVLFYPEVDETKILSTDDSGATTEMTSMTHKKNTDETDQQFIQRLLEGYARTAEGKGGYHVMWLTDEAGNDKIYCVLPENSSSVATYRYVVQDKNSVVIDWKPDVAFSITAWEGKGEVFVNNYQSITGDDQKLTLVTDVTKSYLSNVDDSGTTDRTRGYPLPPAPPDRLLHHRNETIDENVKSRGLRVRPGHSGNSAGDINPALNNHLRNVLLGQKATLLILGDPTLIACSEIEIIFYYPYSLRQPSQAPVEHYTSGKYFVQTIEHEVVMGKFTTKFEVSRAHHEPPSKGS